MEFMDMDSGLSRLRRRHGTGFGLRQLGLVRGGAEQVVPEFGGHALGGVARGGAFAVGQDCLLYTSPSPRD